jgi:nucleoside phosphorylase
MTQIPGSVYRPNIAILTALPKEHSAVEALVDNAVPHTETDHKGTRHYVFGTMPARDGRHEIALAMVGVGNNISAAATTQLLNDLPSVRTVVLSGIAGGVPNTAKVDDHVRLGDIVVSGEQGVIQYDFIKEEYDFNKDEAVAAPRHPPRPANSNLVRAARIMEANGLSGLRPWDDLIRRVLAARKWKRPAASTDILASSDDPSVLLVQPDDPLRKGLRGRPRVFVGTIASSNTLLKSPKRRDALRDRFSVKAVEMEASGTADAAWMSQAQHFVVRGICDYCDINKGEDWQNYAAASAAGYVRALLATIGPVEATLGSTWRRNAVQADAARARGHHSEMPSPDDETLRQIDEARVRLRDIEVTSSGRASGLAPTNSWLTSLDERFQSGRLLTREARAVEAVYEELRRSNVHAHHAGAQVSPVERFSLNLVERYETSGVLRANWEARCAIGNALTLTMSERGLGGRSGLIRDMLQRAASEDAWDVAQLLFDGLHHVEQLTGPTREFLMTTAIEHPHAQVRWNVAAALKSVRITDGDLDRLVAMLLRDRSSWVVKELLDVAVRNPRVMAALEHPGNRAAVIDRLSSDSELLQHTAMGLRPHDRDGFLHRLVHALPRRDEDSSEANANDQMQLADDFRRVERLKESLGGLHGKTYAAAERVVAHRMTVPDPELRQRAIAGYLRGSHEALAWASVRVLFSGELDNCDDDFLNQALSDMLTHPSEWIRRECVEQTLRLDDGHRKYLALRQIEAHRDELALVSEIRPYLVDIGMQFNA